MSISSDDFYMTFLSALADINNELTSVKEELNDAKVHLHVQDQSRKNKNQSFNKFTEQNKIILQNRISIMNYSRADKITSASAGRGVPF